MAKERADEKAAQEKIEKKRSMDAVDARMAEEREKIAREAQNQRTFRSVEAEWRHYCRRPIPPDVERSMQSFLSGQFHGPERSPLTYVGYPQPAHVSPEAWTHLMYFE